MRLNARLSAHERRRRFRSFPTHFGPNKTEIGLSREESRPRLRALFSRLNQRTLAATPERSLSRPMRNSEK